MAVIDESEQQALKPKKEKPESEDDKRRKKMPPGSLMKALIRPGAGDKTPKDGDQVIYHCTIRTLDGVVVESTRADFGGNGIPKRQVLGKSKIILGLLEGIPTMLKGEVAMFKVKPELHYGEEKCPVSVADGFPKYDELHFEIELIDFSKVKVICEDLSVLKKVVEEGQGWEQPREPYEVKAWISAKTGDGKLIFSYNQGEPFFFTFGKSEIPKGLEMGIGTMSRGEKAVIYVNKEYLTQSPLIPSIEGFVEVHFEVELVHFVQVLREFNHVNPRDDEEGKEFSDTRNLLNLNVAACLLKLGEVKKSIEACNKVLDINPGHVKALYRRGMAYMTAGDFEEARTDFNKMITVDKSSESTAKAALVKLKKEEQDIKRRAREQFKGLFDKKPGEISEAVAGDRDLLAEQVSDQNPDADEEEEGLEREKEKLLEANEPRPAGSWSRLWPRGRSLFTAFGVDRCTIL